MTGTRDEIKRIRRAVRDHHNAKWGFLIYRTDHRDDDTFNSLVKFLQTTTHRSLERRDGHDLKQTLDLTVKADKKLLENASLERVQKVFTEWILSDEARLELKAAPWQGIGNYARYTSCVVADLEVLSQTETGQSLKWVKLLMAKIPIPDSTFVEDTLDEEDRMHMEEQEGIEMEVARVRISEVMPDFYSELLCGDAFASFDDWRAMYEEYGSDLELNRQGMENDTTEGGAMGQKPCPDLKRRS
jgi:hypothetical protein